MIIDSTIDEDRIVVGPDLVEILCLHLLNKDELFLLLVLHLYVVTVLHHR